MAEVRIETLEGEAVAAAIPDLARLRIEVFRAFPYLYDGDMDYEREYLRAYAESPDATVVVARDGETVVGAATAAPMEDHAEEFAAPLAARGYAFSDIYYCGESVLLPAYRGRGIGHAFFDRREAAGRALGRRFSAFCAVIRPPDHPARPAGYSPLDPFWRKRGYAPLEGVTARFSWQDVGADAPSEKEMQFWIRRLD